MKKNESRNVHFAFECGPIFYSINEGKKILDGIKIKFNAPHLAVITGASGSGKTTLLKAIAGLNRANVALRLLDNKIFDEKKLPLWRSLVTLLPQDAPIIKGSVEKNIIFPFRFKNNNRPIPQLDEIRKLFNKIGLSHINFDQDAQALSGGERHRLCLVRGMLWKPFVLLADEPLTGIEQELAQKCFDLLKEFSKNSPSIVICTLHNKEIARQADSLWRLKNGKLYRA